ncbi:hypothetical protein [Streptomyces sp. KR55]|uniref:hypothetical protein n=1 Tax=Streptomyces sp. KR55 TaxID=3457425 RepID=UPI003FD3F475
MSRSGLSRPNGWLDTTHDIERILQVHEVGTARDLDPELVTDWADGYGDAGFRVDDEEYFLYGEAQDPVSIRPDYLPHTLKIINTPEWARAANGDRYGTPGVRGSRTQRTRSRTGHGR